MTFQGIIYKITGSCGKVYIGSTTNYYNRRLAHNYKSNETCSKKLKKPIQFEVIRKDEYKLLRTMYLVEQYYIDIYKCVNKKRAYINSFIRQNYKKIYYEKNKDSISKNAKEHYQKNKDSICKKQRDIYQNNEDRRNQQKIWYEANKNSIHSKREDNKEEINKKAREVYQLNKERLKVNCPYCNLRILKNNMKPHQKTKKCKKFQEIKTINLNLNITINL